MLNFLFFNLSVIESLLFFDLDIFYPLQESF